MKKLEKLIEKLRLEPESEYLDFKREWHNNNANLLHDVISLANAITPGDRFLIFGIADDKTFHGVENDQNRKNQSQLIDFLSKANLNIIPKIKLHAIRCQNAIIDLLVIENRPEKPYFIKKEIIEGKKHLHHCQIYTRTRDVNTFADDFILERMFRERFAIDKSPRDRFKAYLLDVKNWNYDYSEDNQLYFYYIPHPEFKIEVHDKTSEPFKQPWTDCFPNKSASKEKISAKYHNTIIYQTLIIFCDGANYITIIPKQFYEEHNENHYLSYYFIKKSMELYLNNMIIKTYWRHNLRYFKTWPVFISEKFAAKSFRSDIKRISRKHTYYFFDSKSKSYKTI